MYSQSHKVVLMQVQNTLKAYNKILFQELTRKRKCLVADCKDNCINSHILQKNGILREISVNNHLIQLSKGIKIKKSNEDFLELKKIGINEAYSFPGFCNYHDSEIFREIESNKQIDFDNLRSQQLFCYRTLCNELRTKEIALDTAKKFKELLDIEQQILHTWFIEGLNQGIKNLMYFKQELESELQSQSRCFEYTVIKLPKLELCITGPLTIQSELNNELSDVTDINQVPFVTSILNIFPYKEHLIAIVALHNKFNCNWTRNLINDLQNANYLKILSDLIVSRTEIWCASPILIDKISKKDFDSYRKTWKDNLLNFNYSIPVDFNLFSGIQ